ncbi:MAG: diacylglycerol kinase [Rubrivivax sp.]|jgi:diacylglycerol kinase (ATP)
MTPDPRNSPFKSRGGLARLLAATGYSWRGLRAGVRHEAAFRQELVLGLPLVLVAPWLGRTLAEVLLLVGSVVLVWIVELLNSALEALADEVSLQRRERLGRAKDLGSAAVMLALLLAALCWAGVATARWMG